jgi:uncharacterized protein with FMN-binding domain
VPARAAAAIVATLAAIALLASFRTPDTARTRVAGLPAAPAGTPTPAPQPTASGGGTPDPGGSAGSPSAPSPSPTPSATAGSGLRDGHYTGEDVSMRYGDVQVRLVVSGGRITDVQAVVLPSDRARSAYISQVAGPMLHDEVLQAQSAQIDSLSGATYTSDAYAQSVQAALDKAHA